jgi:ELWxxDGT repeat protein
MLIVNITHCMERSHIALILANLLLLGSLSGLYVYLSETAKDGAEDEAEDEPDIVHQEVATWTVFYTSSISSLPTCNSDSMGWLYYVGADQKFRVCTASGWLLIDLTGPEGIPGIPGQDGIDGINGLDGIHGINGQDGINGTNGTNGTNGIDGSEGKLALVKMSTEPIGNHCEYGGLRVQVGVDGNRNGVLDGNEIDLTEFVCNGAPGSGGNQPPPNMPQGRVTDINFGSGDSLHSAYGLTNSGDYKVLTSGDVLYFIATDAILGYEIWAYNITSGNIWMIIDLNNGSGSTTGFLNSYELNANQHLLLQQTPIIKWMLFDHVNSTITDYQHSLCRGNSTNIPWSLSAAAYFTGGVKFGNKLYGSHQDGRLGFLGTELWSMDLTNGTCSLIEDIRGGTYQTTSGYPWPLSSNPSGWSIVGNLICFTATTGPYQSDDNQLWCHDPAINSTWRVTDTYPAGNDAVSIHQVNGTTLYFRAKVGGGAYDYGYFAFNSSNGTAWKIIDYIQCQNTAMYAYNMVLIGSKGYLIAPILINSSYDYQFWVIDFNNGSCRQASNDTSNPTSWGSGLIGANIKGIVGTSIIFGFDDNVAGSELWIFETTNNSLWRITDVWAGGYSYDSNPIVLGLFGNTLYFRAYDGQTGIELWAYGMNNGTVWQVIDINRGGPLDSSNPGSIFFIELGSSICFDADDGVHGRELWCI